MNGWQLRQSIEQALKDFQREPLLTSAQNLFNKLGYSSRRTLPVPLGTANQFLERFNRAGNINTERALLDKWESIDLLFQLTGEEIEDVNQGQFFDSSEVDTSLYESYLFFVLKLHGTHYTRTQLAQITREINKPLPPAMVLFQHGEKLTFAVIDRRLHRRDPSSNVLEKVTLLKDIDFSSPSPAHIRILADLSLGELYQQHEFTNFLALHQAWKDTLNTEELNKRFYRELFDWFEWAISEAEFPATGDLKSEVHVIRLITRLLFVWFIKEKGLVADELFNEMKVAPLLRDYDRDTGDSYYRAVLQNLFFGTLNTEMEGTHATDRTFSHYCYEDEITEPETLLQWFAQTPFINGGLFDCLDQEGGDYIDCFGDDRYEQLTIPNRLFFQNGADGSQGLIPLLNSYKFTVEENTTIEEDVALDPELLGRVFEKLLAAYNPETEASAREETGSYYTPREIVNYMTDESLVAYLKDALLADNQQERSRLTITTPPIQQSLLGPSEPVQPEFGVTTDESLGETQESRIEKKLRALLAYSDEPPQFTESEIERLMKTIDSLRVLDPAVGSGAFPMTILHKLTHVLRRLDPDNRRWEHLQQTRAEKRATAAFNISNQQERDDELTAISDTFERYRDSDFGRKLYLIQNSIFGVDSQPVACQIAKLRFFITLAIEQTPDPTQENFGIKPLPNLETRFIVANTLIGLQESEAQLLLREGAIEQLQQEIMTVREKHYLPSNQSQKRSLEAQDEAHCNRLENELETQRSKWIEIQERAIDEGAAQLPNTAAQEGWREMEGRRFEERLQEYDRGFEDVRKIISWKPYDQNATADFFNPEWMFGIRDGFDVVIGNPPYIQLQEDGGRLGDLYEPCNFDSFTRTGDIYCLFYEKANQLSKKGEHVCFITSNKWMRAAYGRKLRDYFIEHTQPVQLLDMGPGVFDATVNTNILLLQNAPSDVRRGFTATTIKSDFDAYAGNIAQYVKDKGVPMELPSRGEPWVILSPAELALKRKIEEVGRPLKDWDINIYRGIVTGCNEAFIIDEAKREELIAQDPESAEIIKPLLQGRDIKRYHIQWEGLYLLFIPWHFPLHEDSTIIGASQEAEESFKERYPFIYNHLLQYQDKLSRRNRSETGIRYEWYALQRCANTYYPEFEQTLIVWGNLAQSPQFTFTDAGFYLSAPATMMVSDSKYLLGILNSRITRYLVSQSAAERQGGYLEFKPMYISLLPIPDPPENEGISVQVSQILDATDTDPTADVSELEDRIDQLVYSLYSLTPKDIEIVEGNS